MLSSETSLLQCQFQYLPYLVFSIFRVEMWWRMFSNVHAYNNSEKTTDFWHVISCFGAPNVGY
jgi:hypothetical protein